MHTKADTLTDVRNASDACQEGDSMAGLPTQASNTDSGSVGISRRTGIVWASLVAAMTVVGGSLAFLESGTLPKVDGLALPALAAEEGPSSVEAIWSVKKPLQRDRWTSIVVHHSGGPVGSPASLDAAHRSANLAGLGHHFVVGNGNGMGDGEIYVGYRWLDQLPGAHVAGPAGDSLNEHAIGICLVGDGQRRQFTSAQMSRLLQVVHALARELGIPASEIYLHSDVAGVSDPGRYFPAAAFREQIASLD